MKHSVSEALSLIYENLKIQPLFVTSGWNQGSKYAQENAEAIVKMANVLATRLFVKQLLLNKGYRLEQWPEETLYRKSVSPDILTKLLEKFGTKVEKV